MEKLILKSISFVLCLCFLFSVAACSNPAISPTPPEIYRISYMPTAGGYISGTGSEIVQRVEKYGDGTEVTAEPAEEYGYFFVGWSDGLTNPTRKETNVQSNLDFTAIFQKKVFDITYQSSVGGQINDATQSVTFGEDAIAVTAVPDEGYLFAGWSDNKMSETRQDKNIREDIAVTANFKSKTKTFSYVYNNATGNNSQNDMSISFDRINEASFVVPTKENYIFDGWYLEPDFITRATDENGTLFLGYGVFFTDSDFLYAKWITSDTMTYKILLVFVDEIHATLEKFDDTGAIDVDYKMSLVERKVCELIPKQMSGYLNEWFEGSVTFEADAFFTTVSIGIESFHWQHVSSMTGPMPKEYCIYAYDIPQMGRILDNYRSVITSFSINDFDNILQKSAGKGGNKYALVHLDNMFDPSNALERYLDISNTDWDFHIDTYLHEFTHTVEFAAPTTGGYTYHEAISASWLILSELEVTRQYLLNQAIVNDETVGIPYTFWFGEMNVYALYIANSINNQAGGEVVVTGATKYYNGYLNTGVQNSIYVEFPFGTDLTVEAIPFEGYKFVRWSDGITTAVRHDKNITSYLVVTAIFEKI